jgi:DNA polymerase-1
MLKIGLIMRLNNDEGQLEVPEDQAVAVGNLAVDCIYRAGLELGFRVPLSGDFKVGKTWAETH